MSKIRILRNTVCGGKWVKAGDVITASPADAHTLIVMKKAEAVDAPAVPTLSGSESPAADADNRAIAGAATQKRKAR